MLDEISLDGYIIKSHDLKYIKINEKILTLCKNYFSIMNNYLNEFSQYEQKFTFKYTKCNNTKIIEILESQHSIIKDLISLLNEFFLIEDKSKNKIVYPLFNFNYELKANDKTRPKTPVKECDPFSNNLSYESASSRKNIRNVNIKKIHKFNKYYNPTFLNSFLNGTANNYKKCNNLNKILNADKNTSLNNNLGCVNKIKQRNNNKISHFCYYKEINTTYGNLIKKSNYNHNSRKSRDFIDISIKNSRTISNIKQKKKRNYCLNRNIKKIYNSSQNIIKKYINY